MKINALVPELAVSELERSQRFYVDRLGFQVVFARQGEGFLFLEREGAQLMLLVQLGDSWLGPGFPAGGSSSTNFAIKTAAMPRAWIDALADSVVVPPFDHQYDIGDGVARVRQFVVRDPDGHLLRFVLELPGRE